MLLYACGEHFRVRRSQSCSRENRGRCTLVLCASLPILRAEENVRTPSNTLPRCLYDYGRSFNPKWFISYARSRVQPSHTKRKTHMDAQRNTEVHTQGQWNARVRHTPRNQFGVQQHSARTHVPESCCSCALFVLRCFAACVRIIAQIQVLDAVRGDVCMGRHEWQEWSKHPRAR